MNEIDKIIEKVQGLLNIAQDESDDHECHSAFLLAQRLMMKYNLSQSDIEVENKDQQNVSKSNAFDEYKILHWWEKKIAFVISKNFRCRFYYGNKKLDGEKRTKSRIVFVGLDDDVQVATEMYTLAHASILFFTDKHMNQYAKNRRERKSAYMRGFLNGIEERFEEQRHTLTQEFGLVLLTPTVVNEFYDNLNLRSARGYQMPRINRDVLDSFKDGYEEGNSIDFTKSTIDG